MSTFHDYNWAASLGDGVTDARSVIGGPGATPILSSSDLLGQAFAPGNQRQPTERTRIGIMNLVFENWLPFTTWILSRFIGPRAPQTNWQSPFDVDASERITRWGPFPSGSRPYPYPYLIGAVSGFMPMLDQLSMQFAFGKTPSGPGVLTPIPRAADITYSTLPKVTG